MRIVKHRGYWAVRVDGKRVSLRTKNREQAERNLEVFKKQYYAPKDTVGEIVKAYLEARKDRASISGMEYAWAAAQSYFSRLKPSEINRDRCIEYARKRSSVSSGTIRKELGLIRQAIRWHDPSTQFTIELPPTPPPRERHLTRAEYESLRDAANGHIKLFIQVAAGTGARRGAILDLTWDRVDFDRAQIRLAKGDEKNKLRATVSIDKTLVDTLRMAKNDSLSEYVISYAGKPVKSINKGFKMACDRAGLKGVTPHTLRHSVAVWLAEAGRGMDEIAQFLGHSNPTTTYKVYARYSPDYLKQAAAILKV